MTNTHEEVPNGGEVSKSKKKKRKSHKGYAFIVYEREKDMKGTIPFIPFCLTRS